MSRGSQRPKQKVIYYKTVQKENGKTLDKPKFTPTGKQGESEPEETNLSGQVVDFKFTEYEHTDGNTYYGAQIKLYSSAEKEFYQIRLGWGSLLRDLINHMCQMSQPYDRDMEISVYTNKDGYHSLSVRVNSEWTGIKFTHKENFESLLYKVEDSNGKEVNNWKKVNAFLKEAAENIIIPTVQQNYQRLLPEISTNENQVKSQPEEGPTDPVENIKKEDNSEPEPIVGKDEDDLPF